MRRLSKQLGLESLEARDVPAVVGGIDPSFGAAGLVRTTFGGTDGAVAVAVQHDGKIVVAGNTSVGSDFAVARYNPDGSLDTTFDGDGKVTINFGFAANDEKASAMVLQDDGKIVIVGTAKIGGDQDFIAARLNADGGLDTSFSNDGKVSFNFGQGVGNNDQAFAVTTQTIGGARKIVVAGAAEKTGETTNFGVVRFNDNGSVDTSFNKTAGGTDIARGVAIDSQNRIVVGGFSNAFGTNDFTVMRFSSAGVFDAAFGVKTVNFGADDQATAVAVAAGDKIVLGGFSDAGAADFAVARLNADGSTDTTFNPAGTGALGSAIGRLTFNFGSLGVVEHANAMALQADGRIVMAGFTALNGTGANPNNFAVARVTADGQLDATFDTDGRATVDFGANDKGFGVALDANGRVVIAGSEPNDFGITRVIGSVEDGTPLAVGGAKDGTAKVFVPDAAGKYGTTPVATLIAFPGFTGEVRTAVADVNGDGFDDTVLATGPGAAVRFAVVSGKDNSTLLVNPTDPFGDANFKGGLFVTAADLDNDGRAEVMVSPDEGGGPRVTTFSLVNGTPTQRANFFGIDDPNFRGGARIAVGDINGDGVQDLVVGAGFLGGPRVAVWDGKTVFATPTRVVSDFFGFPGNDAVTLRNGAFVAAGDVNGDGFADLILGGGPGGAPRLFVLSGQQISAGNVGVAQSAPIANFFVAGNTADVGGVRVAAKDADGDHKADIVVGTSGKARVYLGKNVTTAAEPATFQDLDPFTGAVLANGVFVG